MRIGETPLRKYLQCCKSKVFSNAVADSRNSISDDASSSNAYIKNLDEFNNKVIFIDYQ